LHPVLLLFAFASPAITVDNSFESNSRRRFQMIAGEVERLAREYFQASPPIDLPLFVRRDRSGPLTELDDWTHPTRIYIGLKTVAPFYAQFAYQLGHEIAHVYLNPRRANGILESIATAFSYEVLDRLAESWKTSAPFDYARAHAEELSRYRARAEQEALSHFPRDIRSAVTNRDWPAVRIFLKSHASELDQLSASATKSESGRAWQSLAAICLRSAPIDWPKFADLGRCTDPTPDRDPTLRYAALLGCKTPIP
jgi:hypothetical protein